jgi:3-hydroxyisobutyrate dehydrogenase
VKGGVEPLALFRAIRQGATGRKRTFDRLPDQFLQGKYDPAAFSLRLAHKDLSLALELAREAGVPMKIGEIAFAEMEEGMRRGWSGRDFRVVMTLQEERAGVAPRISADALRKALEE